MMAQNGLMLFLLHIVIAVCCSAAGDSIQAGLFVNKVDRTVDLTTHLPKIHDEITLENSGKGPVSNFIFALDPLRKDLLAFIGASVGKGEDETQLNVDKTTVTGQSGNAFFRIQLPKALDNGGQTTLTVTTVYSHSLVPYPSQITQAEKQFMKFEGNLYLYSPYRVATQTTTVNCASSNIESYTKTQPVKVSDSTITYGPFTDKEPHSEGEIVVHFENNTPFLAVTHLHRLIEVSHWGNIAVEETIDIRHYGAVLKGPFSRYEYQRNQDGVSSIKAFKTVLPASTRDVYYRDEIGNISTSHLKEMDDQVEVELRPRFPLFGGWKTHYVLGYNLPSYQYLYHQGDNYLLKMRFLDHVYDDQVIDSMTLQIILPEGVKNMHLKTPYPAIRDDDHLHYTYLDTIGRPVVTVHKTNLVEQHIQDFELKYTFSKFLLLQEPLLVVTAFYLLFLVVIVYVRMDFSITKDEASESRMRVASLVESIQAIQDRRSALYQSYDDAINKYKSGKDAAAFSANRKKIDTSYKQLSQQINGLLAKLKVEGSDTADKVSELQRLDAAMRDQINLCISSAEKLVTGKLNKSQYLEAESSINNKRDDLYQKMETLLTSL